MLDLTTKFGRVAKQHLKSEYFVWLTTVDSRGTPQPRPVWFIWDDNSFLIFSQAKAYKVKHLKNNPKISLHFNTKDKNGNRHVVVFTGEAVFDADSPPVHKFRAYVRKYKLDIASLKMTPAEFGADYSVAIRIKPTDVRGWE